jgi:hypothetical protein
MSNVDIKDIMVSFNVSRDKVKQFNTMQLFIVDTSYLGRLLISYKTTIGIFHNLTWFITTQKFSTTTSRQITIFARSTHFDVIRLDSDSFQDMLDGISRL